MREKGRLLGYILGSVLPLGLLLCAALLTIQQVVFAMTFQPQFGREETLEQAMQRAGFQPLFLTFLLLCMAVLAWCMVRRWLGSKSIYSLCMLPVPRSWLYACWVLAGIVLLLLLVIAQYGSLYLADGQYDRAVGRLLARTGDHGNTADYFIENNKLFRAFLRWDFLQLFRPNRLYQGLVAICFLAGPPALTVRLVCGIFARKLPAILCGAGVWLLLAMVAVSATRVFTVTAGLCVAGMLLVSVWAVLSGMRMLCNGDAV